MTRTVHQALADLHAAAAALTQARQHTVQHDDGTTTDHPVPSLLDQLRDSTGHGGETGHARRSGQRLPINAAAVELLRDITAGATDLHDRALDHRPPTIEDRVRMTLQLVDHWDDPDAIDWATGWLHHWRHAIAELLDPPRRLELVAACPACAVTTVWRDNPDTGERTRVPALTVDPENGAACLACGQLWPLNQLQHLARVLGCTPIAPRRRVRRLDKTA